MKSLKVEPLVEADLRRKILEYFLFPGYTATMPHTEPFQTNIKTGLYTNSQLTFVRRSLWSAGLLEHVRGTTIDNVLVITEQGRSFLQRDNVLSGEET